MTSATSTPRRAGAARGRRRVPADVVGLVARLVLGGVIGVAGALKLPHLGQSVLAVRAYKLLPYDVAVPVGYALPIVEIAVGLLLVLGLFTRAAAAVAGLAMVAFIVGISWAWSHGYALDCGCFGGGGEIALQDAVARYPWDIARDVGLLLLAVWLVVRPHSRYALDDRLFPDPDVIAPAEPDTAEEDL